MLLENAKLMDGRVADVRIAGAHIEQISPSLKAKEAERRVDCKGLTLLPSLVDLGVFLHNLQAKTYTELKTQAFKGGVGAIMGIDLAPLYSLNEPEMQPLDFKEAEDPLENTIPKEAQKAKDPICLHPLNARQRLQNLSKIVSGLSGPACLYIYNLEGQKLLPALDYAKMLKLPLVCGVRGYEGRPTLGIADTTPLAYKLGLPSVSPLIQIKEVGKYASMALHTKIDTMLDSVVEIEALHIATSLKNLGAPLFVQTPLHHLILTENVYQTYDPRFKILPPLKSQDQQKALQKALQEGKIDMLTSLHYTRPPQGQQIFEEAPFGVHCIENAFSLAYTHLVQTGLVSLEKLIDLMAATPARFLGLNCAEVCEGKEARLMLVDLKGACVVENPHSPYYQESLKGRVCFVFQGEDIVYGA
ncbi:amidohydrolase family protein [Helicobacter ailurogastricus]|uniref:Dihydroorotase n=1 Tax=Helicobacter ailurogastricus TaxID=1578720 RepID=A0A0K2Y561_9HELI|nr:amidohydrolase family protein [Helicobacter ailurogastricus]CRF41391.1 Dihydroorotase [Helicobacter ailurogastricus]CRF41992.1 Dihydroorotase [Helicobacter ailurogastricus]CRF43642.1 Dihydroorotase [Helicobacter ailurogastricus]CRF53009.1 Dihydroorotase [Helicobacter ailurogastricus]GLH57700.1 Dihydroorotase PyrC [Helicobacter ailurogastricus]